MHNPPPKKERPATVVALHCSAGGPRQWDAYRAMNESVQWHTPHLIGYGDTLPWSQGEAVTLQAEAQRILPLLESQCEPAALVGHSYGGAVALQAASLWPELVSSVSVYEPVLFDLLFDDARNTRQAHEIRGIAGEVVRLTRSGQNEAAAGIFVDYWSGEGAWSRIKPHRQAEFAQRMSKTCAEFDALFNARMNLAAFTSDGPPIRIVAGTASPATVRRVVDVMQCRLPHAVVTRLPGAGHMGPLTEPLRVAELLLPGHAMSQLRLAA